MSLLAHNYKEKETQAGSFSDFRLPKSQEMGSDQVLPRDPQE